MNKTLSTTLTVIAVLALGAIIFFAGSMYSRMNTYGFSMMGGWNHSNTYGPGGMTLAPGASAGVENGRGPSMMQGYGTNNANLTPLTVDQAKAAAEKYLAKLNNSDLKIAEVMIFDNNA